MSIFGESRRFVAGLAAAALLTVSVAGVVGAETGGSGNGGASNANSDGGSVNMGDIDSGSSTGDVASIVSDAIAAGGDNIAATIISQILGS
jgi:hypothetical protein